VNTDKAYTPAWAPERSSNARWHTIILILAVLALRLVYLAWLSPMELVGDEAYYWEWSRHLDLCYYEKGPGLAYLVAASVRLFGVSEFAVRLPMAVLSAAATWVLARLTVSTTGSERAGFFAAVCFSLIPAFQGNAQICTQDGPIIFFWIALAAAGLRLFRRWQAGQDALYDWLLVAGLLGLGVLFKQSMPLIMPSFAIYWFLQRRQLNWRRSQLVYVGLAIGVFVLVISPMLIWNIQHHWPTFAHTLGHLGSENGDEDRSRSPLYSPLWTLSFLGAQIGAIGPGAIALMAMACIWAIRSRKVDSERWPQRLWMMCCALPSLAFFLALTVHKEVLGNWPFPSFTTLVVLVGEMAAVELPRHKALVTAWMAQSEPRPKAGWLRRSPETPFRGFWNLTLIYGIVGWLVLSFPNWIVRSPGLGKSTQAAILRRISGHRQHAMELQAALNTVRDRGEKEPIIVSRYYMTAALYAFYLPGHPDVYNAGSELGKRPSSYDFWPQTNFADPRLLGRPILLDGQGAHPWAEVFSLSHMKSLDSGKYFLGVYQGIRHDFTEPALPHEAIGHAAVIH
jgi:4-amino-4-deoxy-L-arabinose transferase-like glycosyltransferase